MTATITAPATTEEAPLYRRAETRLAVVGKGKRIHYSATDDTLCGKAITRYTDVEEAATLGYEHCGRCIRAAEDRAYSISLAGASPLMAALHDVVDTVEAVDAARRDLPTVGQMTTLARLLDELADATGEAATHRDNARLLLANHDMTFRLASTYLDRLIPAARALRAEAAAARAANDQAAAKAAAALEPGMYARDGRVYRVVLSEAGRLYAKVWAEGDDDTPPSFEFAPGAIRHLRPEHRMSAEDAKAYSRRIGACCVCGKTLTDPASIERGIGPVCADKV
ncbi:DUF6011 domain-containing protein [Actinacidiphila sp. DG2A-62]|uniref:DUF6011 domain-containing protein n=1 Tax=Actinacidiphila sp. DG2A-62 TaxID=3108821 RepID=UPI002DB9C95B|nr:DUF6011 domain-containing protein [Actinacidiphila sp. DG2A-62]MEC3995034.1 DUF6011 domain-containing protein [Actinacidiphila sp. DG2A-62]